MCAVLDYEAASSNNFLPVSEQTIFKGYFVPKRRLGITTIRCVIAQKIADLTYSAAEA